MVRFNLHTDLDGKQSIDGPFQMHDHDFQAFERAVERWKATRMVNGGQHAFVQDDGTIKLEKIYYPMIVYIERLP